MTGDLSPYRGASGLAPEGRVQTQPRAHALGRKAPNQPSPRRGNPNGTIGAVTWKRGSPARGNDRRPVPVFGLLWIALPGRGARDDGRSEGECPRLGVVEAFSLGTAKGNPSWEANDRRPVPPSLPIAADLSLYRCLLEFRELRLISEHPLSGLPSVFPIYSQGVALGFLPQPRRGWKVIGTWKGIQRTKRRIGATPHFPPGVVPPHNRIRHGPETA
jgi:hypothetical protein